MNTLKLFRTKTSQVIACTLLSATISTYASASDIGFSIKAGTLGLGMELDYKINELFNVRLQTNSYTYDDEFEEDGIDYEGEINFSSTGILVDWRPFEGSFKLTGGVYANNNELSGNTNSIGDETYEIGGALYSTSSSDPLQVSIDAALGNSTAGYLGLGWGNSPSNNGWMFSVELGVLLSGEPTVDLSASGTAIISQNGSSESFNLSDTSNPLVQEFQNELVNEELKLEDDISDFNVYPVIAIGVGYRF
jgi:hypothetical protein